MIDVCVATMQPQLALSCLERLESRGRVSSGYLIHLNGEHLDTSGFRERWSVNRSAKNIGVVPAYHLLWQMSTADLLFYIHDDVEMDEENWDLKILDFMQQHPKCLVAGLGVAKDLGVLDPVRIYQRGKQIAGYGSKRHALSPLRGPFHSNMRSAERYGPRISEPTRGVCVDGFGFVVRRSLLEQLGGWSWWPLMHHGYDTAISLEALRAGGEVWGLPLACEHLERKTSRGEAYLAQVGGRAGDDDLYLRAQQIIRERYADLLPARQA